MEEYTKVVNEGHFPIFKGHSLTEEDLMIRQHILDLMCKYQTNIDSSFKEVEDKFVEFVKDDLIDISFKKIIIKESGKLFLRNICLAFDKRYWKKVPNGNVFSTTA